MVHLLVITSQVAIIFHLVSYGKLKEKTYTHKVSRGLKRQSFQIQ